jgi:cytolysin-activating lysine-acyltransferase
VSGSQQKNRAKKQDADAGASKPAPEHALMGAALSKMISVSVGDIAVLMSRSAAHQHYTLADIEWLILPPVMLGQFYVAEAQDEANGFRAPVALITWARVSPDVDRRLSETAGQPPQLTPEEWACGDIVWLIDVVGAQKGLVHALEALRRGPCRDARYVARDGGTVTVARLTEAMGTTS